MLQDLLSGGGGDGVVGPADPQASPPLRSAAGVLGIHMLSQFCLFLPRGLVLLGSGKPLCIQGFEQASPNSFGVMHCTFTYMHKSGSLTAVPSRAASLWT